MLFKDNEEVPTTKVMKEMVDDKYLVRTNPYSSVDIAYLNSFSNAKYQYGNGTEITIRYVELADVPVIPYTQSMFLYGTLDNYSTISPYLTFEPVDSIKVTAPLFHETQNLIRSKADYASSLRINVPSVSETNFTALTPTYTLITYLKDTFTLLTGTLLQPGSSEQNTQALEDTEIGEFNKLLKQENYFGTPLPDITVPRREVADLDISIALKNKYTSIADINLDIENILKNYYNTYLNVSFSTYDLERKIEDLPYVKYARVSYKINERKVNSNYQLGHIIKDNDSYYKVSKILGRTGSSNDIGDWDVPLTPGTEIDTNAVILDGTIYWKCFKKLPNMPKSIYSERTVNKQYGIGDYMHRDEFPNYMFKCIDLVKTSGGTAPDTTNSELGDFIVDNGIVWVVREKLNDSLTKTWSSLTSYRLGEVVNTTGDYSLECVSYTGNTNSDENLEFEQSEYKLEYPTGESYDTEKYFYVEGNKMWYFNKGDTIEAQDSQGYTKFIVKSCGLQGDYTVIEPETSITRKYENLFASPRGTQDEGILWTLVDDINNVSYDWNSYVTFTHNLTILE